MRGVSSAYQVHTAQQSAADVATSITALEQPSAGAKKLKFPSVPQGFTVKIASSSVSSVIQTDGTIVPPSKETTVTLELEITRTSDDSKALTAPLTVKVLPSVPSPEATLVRAVAQAAMPVKIQVMVLVHPAMVDNQEMVTQVQRIRYHNLNRRRTVLFWSCRDSLTRRV